MISKRTIRSLFSSMVVPLRDNHFLKFSEGYFRPDNGDYKIEFQVAKTQEQIKTQGDYFNNVELSLSQDLQVGELCEQLKDHFPNSKNFSIYNVEQNLIANVTTLEQLMKEPFYLVPQNDQMYYIQNKNGYSKDTYKYIKKYFLKMEVPMLERKIMLSYLIRLDNILDLNIKSKLFQDEQTLTQQQQSVLQVDKSQLISSMLDAYPDMRNTQSDHEQALFQNFFRLKNQYDLMRAQKRELLKISAKQTQRQMLGGLLVLIGHFCFMSAGIYVYYDWDVMEPIGYFLNTGGAIFLSYQYFQLDAEWTHSRLSRYLIDKNFTKICKRIGFDNENLQQVEQELQGIRERIKTNLITNL